MRLTGCLSSNALGWLLRAGTLGGLKAGYLRECQKVVSVRGLEVVEPKAEVKRDGLADTE